MEILALNSGSSTLKFDLIELGDGADIRQARKLAHGVVDRIGHDSAVDFQASSGPSERRQAAVRDHKEAVAEVFAWLSRGSGIGGQGSGLPAGQSPIPDPRSPSPVSAAGHRVVH